MKKLVAVLAIAVVVSFVNVAFAAERTPQEIADELAVFRHQAYNEITIANRHAVWEAINSKIDQALEELNNLSSITVGETVTAENERFGGTDLEVVSLVYPGKDDPVVFWVERGEIRLDKLVEYAGDKFELAFRMEPIPDKNGKYESPYGYEIFRARDGRFTYQKNWTVGGDQVRIGGFVFDGKSLLNRHGSPVYIRTNPRRGNPNQEYLLVSQQDWNNYFPAWKEARIRQIAQQRRSVFMQDMTALCIILGSIWFVAQIVKFVRQQII